MQIKLDITPLFEDKSIALCEKPPHVLTLPDEKGERGLIDFLSDYYSEKGERTELYPVHRLDRQTGGLVVFAKTKKTASELSAIFAEHRNVKEYIAILDGAPPKDEDELKNILFADKRANKSYVVDRERKGAKEAVLSYTLLAASDYKDRQISLVRVTLKTGRMHQIRAQLSHIGAPLLGDGKYGSKENRCDVALWSYHLAFSLMDREYKFFSFPDICEFPWTLFSEEIEKLKKL